MSSAVATVPERIAQPATRLRPRFAGVVRGEALKLVRQRAIWVMTGLAIVLFLIVIAALSSEPHAKAHLEADPQGWYVLRLNIFTTVFDAGAGIFLLIASARLVAMEYSSGTIRVLLGRGTGRLQLLGAKLLALTLTGLTLLLVYLVAASTYVFATVVTMEGNFSRIANLPNAWHDLGLNIVIALVSIGINILIGTTAAVLGRSLAFGLGAALAFFPTDNFGTIVMDLLNRLTNQHIWQDVTAYFLGPNLNVLQPLLVHGERAAFAQPSVDVDATHAFVVTAAYAVVLLAVSIILTRRRDVLQ